MCTLDKVKYIDSQCRELWQLDIEQYFTHGGVILVSPMQVWGWWSKEGGDDMFT